MAQYTLNNGLTYKVTSDHGRMKVEVFREYFDGKFLASTGDITYLDNMAEVREFLKDENGGVQV